MSQFIDLDFKPSDQSLKEFQKFISKLENVDFKVDADFSGAENESKKFAKEANKVIEKEVGDAFEEVSNQSKGIFENLTSNLKGGFDSIIAGFAGGAGFGLVTQGFEFIAGSIGEAYNNANEFNNALLDIQAKTGATAQEMVGLEEAAKSAFLGGVGESLADATRTIGEAQTLLGDTFTGQELGDFTAKAQALGNLFDKDVNEVIQKATPFVKNFGLSSEEAFNLLAKGLREGKTPSDDLLDTFAEYSQLLANAGFSAGQFTELLSRGGEVGAFSLDKIADAAKETNVRLRAGDIQKTLGEIGAGNELEQNLIDQLKAIEKAGADGTKTVQEVLQESASLISDNFKSDQISETLATQLNFAFSGTPAEDLGTELYGRIFSAPLDEATIQASAEKIGNEVSNAVGQYNPFDQLIRQAELFITVLGRDVLNIITDVFNVLASAILNVSAFISDLLSSIANSPFAQLISETFTNIKNTILDLIPTIDEIKSGFETFKQVISDLSPLIVFAAGAFAAYQISVNSAAIATQFFNVASKAAAIAQGVVNTVTALGSGILTAAAAAYNFVASGQAIATVKTYLFAAAQKVLNLVLSLNPIGLVVTALAALAAGFIYAYKQSEDFRKIIDNLYKKAIKPLIDGLADGVRKVLKFFGLLSEEPDTKGLDKVKEKEEEVVDNTEKVVESQETLQTTIKETGKVAEKPTLDGLINKLAELRIKTDDLTNANDQQRKTYDQILKQAQGLVKNNKDLEKSTKDVKTELGLLTAEADKFLDFIKQSQDRVVDIEFNLEIDKLKRDVAEVGNLINQDLNIESLDFSDAVDKADQYYKDLQILRQRQLDANIEQIEKEFDIEEKIRSKNFVKEITQLQKKFEEQKKLAIAEGRDVTDIEKQFTEESRAVSSKYQRESENATRDFNNKIKELEKKNNDDIINDKKDRDNKLKELEDKRRENIISSINSIGGSFAEFASNLTEQLFKLGDLIDAKADNWEDYGEIVGNVIGQGAKLAEENSDLQKSLAVTEVVINTAVAISKALSQLGAFATPAAIAIGAIGAAQIATILGAEDGVIGLNSSYNKKPGKTDKYPFLLAKGESVVNAQSTAQNRPYLEFINNGGNIGRDIINPLIRENQSMKKELQDMKKILKTATLSKVNLVVENRNNSNVRIGAVRV